ncbi:hypothetical protein GWE18_39730 [Bradyrhizobium sp. CSA112]|uniref:hypothetical protein n=1 Tax=Bradyrhizobium sp. CSA112 TaxID=2699170 RepID=UPI0023B0FBA6|nr:hypothetical protein [Bradyrhizobium sp. CSA112]MDE5458768.1 hypothetical protein [Bradyrhizobium sp. CSA112]
MKLHCLLARDCGQLLAPRSGLQKRLSEQKPTRDGKKVHFKRHQHRHCGQIEKIAVVAKSNTIVLLRGVP